MSDSTDLVHDHGHGQSPVFVDAGTGMTEALKLFEFMTMKGLVSFDFATVFGKYSVKIRQLD